MADHLISELQIHPETYQNLANHDDSLLDFWKNPSRFGCQLTNIALSASFNSNWVTWAVQKGIPQDAYGESIDFKCGQAMEIHTFSGTFDSDLKDSCPPRVQCQTTTSFAIPLQTSKFFEIILLCIILAWYIIILQKGNVLKSSANSADFIIQLISAHKFTTSTHVVHMFWYRFVNSWA